MSDMAADRDLRTPESAAPPSAGAGEMGLSGIPALPEDALILIPTRNLVLFPGMALPIALGRPRSIHAAQRAVREQRQVGIVMQRSAETTDPLPVDLHRMGTIANIVRR